MAEIPDVGTVRAWSSVSTASLTDDQVQAVIDTEAALQAACCLVPADYPTPLAQAMLRRCSREIAARGLPLGLAGDTGGDYAPVRLPSFDVEIERLEAPYRIVAVA
jgi:hypothetical protein